MARGEKGSTRTPVAKYEINLNDGKSMAASHVHSAQITAPNGKWVRVRWLDWCNGFEILTTDPMRIEPEVTNKIIVYIPTR